MHWTYHLATGILSYTPLLKILQKGTRGTNSAEYCYSTWLRHLVMANQNGMHTIPSTIAELGPGDSLGIGLAGLLSGADRLVALEAFDHVNNEMNLQIFDNLLTLFQNRAPIGDANQFPRLGPKLDSYSFPSSLLTDEQLTKSLAPERVTQIREQLANLGKRNENESEQLIRYIVPWDNSEVIEEETIDFLYSQAVLEHVEDIPFTYG
ncbi:hypothetical protein K8I28_15815, partial [bacterium]|nr:hypothetical protein [bacterium]